MIRSTVQKGVQGKLSRRRHDMHQVYVHAIAFPKMLILSILRGDGYYYDERDNNAIQLYLRKTINRSLAMPLNRSMNASPFASHHTDPADEARRVTKLPFVSLLSADGRLRHVLDLRPSCMDSATNGVPALVRLPRRALPSVENVEPGRRVPRSRNMYCATGCT